MQSQQQGVFEELKGKRKYQKRERISLFKVTCLVPLAPQQIRLHIPHCVTSSAKSFGCLVCTNSGLQKCQEGSQLCFVHIQCLYHSFSTVPYSPNLMKGPQISSANTLELSLRLSYSFTTACLYLPSFINSTFAMSAFCLPYSSSWVYLQFSLSQYTP